MHMSHKKKEEFINDTNANNLLSRCYNFDQNSLLRRIKVIYIYIYIYNTYVNNRYYKRNMLTPKYMLFLNFLRHCKIIATLMTQEYPQGIQSKWL